MEKIIDALLEQRKRLIQEICDLDFNSGTSYQKTQALEKRLAEIDSNIFKLVDINEKRFV
jgi:regulator of sigma D